MTWRAGGVALALAGAVLFPRGARAQDALPLGVTPGFDNGRWLGPTDPVRLRLSAMPTPDQGRLAVIVGESDLTAMFDIVGDELVLRPSIRALPSGERDLAVYLVTPDRKWELITRIPVKVLSPDGYEVAKATPRLAMTNKGQLAEGNGGAAAGPPESNFQDFAGTAGLQTTHVRNGWTVSSQANMVAASNIQEALRFGELQGSAPKADLADYLIKVDRGPLTLSLGHISYGSQRHLIDGFASRGLGADVRLGPARVGLAAMNGSSIVGWSNPLGLASADHRVVSGTLGLELIPSQPGRVAIEATVLDGSVLPRPGYTQGVVNDAEESRGVGFRLRASDPGERVSVEAGFARSRFDNPPDPTLAQGEALVPVAPTSRNARYLQLGVGILRNAAIGSSLQASLAATFRHERVDPLYRSVATATRADVLDNVVGLTGSLGRLAVQATHGRSRDNLAELASLLTTRTRVSTVAASLPLAALVRKESAWLPMLTWQANWTHQAGDTVPENSGFSSSHVPDQKSRNHTIGLEWQGNGWRAGYGYNHSFQDNRQPGRELADFANLAHTASLGYTPFSALDLSLDLGLESADNLEVTTSLVTTRIGGAADWRVTRSSTIGLGYATTRTADDPRTDKHQITDLRLELSQRIRILPPSTTRAPLQVFLRYAKQTTTELPLDGPPQSGTRWTVSSGLSMGLF
ncbi:MAG TPA: hypothetical protein VJU15_05855 [Gemmatimonadales bacterium]|nr:hypothetical protein [Gemmatimonadales bacterium]